MSARERDKDRPRGFARFGICVLLAIILVSFMVQVLTSRIRTITTWEVVVASAPGLPPADVYCGEELLGKTPLTIFCDRDDPRFRTIEMRDRRKGRTIMEVLGFDLEIIAPPQKVTIEPDFIAWTIRGEWPDDTLDEFIYFVVRDGLFDKYRAFVLRARRPGEARVPATIRHHWQSRRQSGWFQRNILRVSHRHETLRVTLGKGMVPPPNPERPWLFEKTPVGAKRLVTPRSSVAHSTPPATEPEDVRKREATE